MESQAPLFSIIRLLSLPDWPLDPKEEDIYLRNPDTLISLNIEICLGRLVAVALSFIKSINLKNGNFRFATKTKVKVGRALSMNRTPNKFTRVVSTIRPFSAQRNLTPKPNRLAQMRLQSCANLTVSQYFYQEGLKAS